ncbi:MAG TPA: PEP/pyruvate-binding domain-containing protein, partial [Pyrinomonadaceae bacterium]|nr:PEP/pyruvate-binding domain-containing protein [Pyrinomonadaceae bacterium]
MSETPYVLDLSQVGAGDVALVGGKCASLGELFRELTQQGVRAVDGFSTTSHAYEMLLQTGDLRGRLKKLLKGLDVNNLEELARVGGEARRLMLETPFPAEVETAIHEAYIRLGERIGKKSFEVAVRSSATAEDLPDASFAGQQDTILNVRGEKRLIE